MPDDRIVIAAAGGLLTRLMPAPMTKPSTVNADARTVELVVSTGAPVYRSGWRPDGSIGPWIEALDVAGVDLTRLNAGISPVLLDHVQLTDRMIGIVESASIAGAELRAVVRFSRRAEVEPIWTDVQDGILRQVSCGYAVNAFKRQASGADEPARFLITSWTPAEISFVPIAADPGASVRATPNSEPSPMTIQTPQTPTGGAPGGVVAQPSAPITDATGPATVAEVRAMVRAHHLPESFALNILERGVSLAIARRAVLDELADRSEISQVRSARVEGGFSGDDPAFKRTAMIGALVSRMTGRAPDSASREYAGLGLADMARELLLARGENISGLSRAGWLERAHTTSDFPELLQGSGIRVLLSAYETAPSPLKAIAREAQATDFRPMSRLRLGEFPQLKKVNENGEVHHGTSAEAKEAYRIASYARIFALSRQAIINDDLGAFADWNVQMGRAAAELEATELVALLTANSGAGVTMEDEQPLYHSTHANIAGSGTAIDVTNLGAARQAMREQKALDGTTPAPSAPRYLVVSPAKETEAEKVLATLYPAQVSNANPFPGRLELAVEPRLTGNAWRLFADPAMMPVLEYAYLATAKGPQYLIRPGFETLGVEVRVSLDFGCGALDSRGTYLNSGA